MQIEAESAGAARRERRGGHRREAGDDARSSRPRGQEREAGQEGTEKAKPARPSAAAMPVDPAIQGMLSLLAAMNRPIAADHGHARGGAPRLPHAHRGPAAGRTRSCRWRGRGARGAGRRRPAARRASTGPAPTGELPTIVFFHGGGFVLGRRGHARQPVPHALPRGGAVVLSVEYRLAPGGALPRRRRGLLRAPPAGPRSTSPSSAGTRTASPWPATAPAATSPRWSRSMRA